MTDAISRCCSFIVLCLFVLICIAADWFGLVGTWVKDIKEGYTKDLHTALMNCKKWLKKHQTACRVFTN